jgi:hypothetical protein
MMDQNKDSLQIHRNKDGSFSVQWDKEDPNWSFMNQLTSKEIQSMIEQAMKNDQGVY